MSVLRRSAALGLLASLLALTGCRTAVSDASTTSTATSTVTTTTTTRPTTTSVFALPPLPPAPLAQAPATTTTAAPTLAAALAGVWAHTPSSSCLTVLDGNGVVFERNTDAAVLPASTMKLLTATAVLARLDPSSRLTTRVLATAPPGLDGTVQGDVWLVGGGDPLLGT